MRELKALRDCAVAARISFLNGCASDITAAELEQLKAADTEAYEVWQAAEDAVFYNDVFRQIW